MKTFISTSLVAIGLFAGAAQAAPIDSFFTDLGQSAPKSVFDQLNETAPKSIFDQIRDSAPRSIFDDLRDSAPRSGGVFGELKRNAP